ncbi:4-amino-4-deoxy-L-arabinose transferase [Formivibrio citricus]|uniref:4-amino-4-deoxy-L-arabinose transferase n=1 Tax=Formivibrio citricus TaxID=83765 RepID=A0A1I4Y3C2_9NEIS|nr:glycosyltransferase family 39 protein [Formivibrio citricus]SFN32536.1 4-amino-4-deoxy-L-arabinose transferase [Formivibrio citricus]
MPFSPSRRQLWLLLALFTLLWFGALGYRKLITPDEGRYATIAWEMVTSGDWLTPRLNGVKYFEKPALQYWATALGFLFFGQSDFVARLWPALTGFLAVIGLFFTGRRIWNEQTGLIAALLLACNLWWLGNGHFLTLDMGVSALLCGALCGFLLAQHDGASERENRNGMLLAWGMMALAVLQKGLIGLLIPGSVLVLYTVVQRDWRLWTRLHLGKGLLLFFAITAPWFVLVSRANPEFAWFFFIHEHFLRFATKVHRRAGAWWYFFPILIAGLMPWTSLLPQALYQGWKKEASRFQVNRFLLIWAVFIFAFFSKSSSKLPSYILPMFPALALLTAQIIGKMELRKLRWHLIPGFVLAFGLLIAAPIVFRMEQGGGREALHQTLAYWLGGAGIMALLLMVAAWIMQRKGHWLAALTLTGLTALAAGQLAALGHNAFALTNSSWYLVQALKPQIGPNTKLYVFRDYDQTLPFYLKRHLQFVEYRDEFEFGQKQEPAKFMDILSFVHQWQSDSDAVLITAKWTKEEIVRLKLPVRVIYEDPDRTVYARK